MKRTDVYIYYSAATDVTGKNIQNALGINGGKELPPKTAKMVIGWGAKTDKDIDLGKVEVLNHPNSIKNNRNKLNALTCMQEGKVSVAPFVAADKAIGSIETTTGTISLPVIGRTKFHQGGKGFWACPTKTHVAAAIEDGAQYFQNMIEIDTEFRVHVVNNEIVYAVKKVKRTKEEFEAAFIEDEMNRQKKLAEINKDKIDEDTMMLFLRRQAKNASAGGANMMVRSNKMGWKFSKIKTVPDAVSAEVYKAVKALGLNFGAVDCCTDSSGKVYVIEVNTGPGLETSTFDAYIKAFEKIIDAKPVEEVKPVKAVEPEPVKTTQKKVADTFKLIGSEADVLSEQLLRLQKELVGCNDPNELAALKRLGAKIIFGGE